MEVKRFADAGVLAAVADRADRDHARDHRRVGALTEITPARCRTGRSRI